MRNMCVSVKSLGMPVLVVLASVWAAQAAAPGSMSPVGQAPMGAVQWQQDLDFLAANLPQKHKNAFFKLKQADFESAVREFRAAIPSLEEPAVVLGFNRIVALLGDAHTEANTGAYQLKYPFYPLVFSGALKDGFAVVAASPERQDLIGCALMSIDGMPVAEVIDRVATLYPWENRAWKLALLRGWLPQAEALKVVGVAKSNARGTFGFRTLAGETKSVELESAPVAALKLKPYSPTWLGPAAVSRKPNPEALWFEMLPGTRALYVPYLRCRDDTNKKIADYTKELVQRLDAGGIDRLIIDLRYNTGGNSELIDPFVRHLAGRKEFAHKGALIALTGGNTFSSGHSCAHALRKQCHAVVIGGPTGQKPNGYGEVLSFRLPNSGLEISYSTKYFTMDDADPESMMPDVLVEPTIAEFVGGRDMVLEAAVNYKPSQ